MKTRLLPVVLALALVASVMVFPLASAAQSTTATLNDSGEYHCTTLEAMDFHTIDLDTRSSIHIAARENKLHYSTTAQNLGEVENLLGISLAKNDAFEALRSQKDGGVKFYWLTSTAITKSVYTQTRLLNWRSVTLQVTTLWREDASYSVAFPCYFSDYTVENGTYTSPNGIEFQTVKHWDTNGKLVGLCGFFNDGAIIYKLSQYGTSENPLSQEEFFALLDGFTLA